MTAEDENKLRQELEATEFRWDVHVPPTGWLLSYAHNRGGICLPPEIMRALGAVVPELENSSFIPVVFEESSSFGYFFVTFAAQRRALTIVWDLGQLLVSGLP